MDKKRILVVNDSVSNSSGVFRSLLPLLNAIPYDRFETALFIPPECAVEEAALRLLPKDLSVVIGRDRVHYYRYPEVFFLHLCSRGCGMLRLKQPAAFFARAARKRIRFRKLKNAASSVSTASPFDAVVANTVPWCSEIAALIPARRRYAVFHSSSASFFPEQTRAVFRDFDAVVAVSEGVASMLRQAYPDRRAKLIAIPNYVDASAIRKLAAETAALEHNAPVICSCGRLSREKGFDLAVEAARLLRERGFAFVWYFVGDGEERKKLEALSEAYRLRERIRFVGFTDNPYPYIGGADIYVQPSYEEAQPMAIMEALTLSRAVVSTETLGGRTILQDGRGVLTPISAEGLADGVASLLTDENKRLSLQRPYKDEDDRAAKRAYESAWLKLLEE